MVRRDQGQLRLFRSRQTATHRRAVRPHRRDRSKNLDEPSPSPRAPGPHPRDQGRCEVPRTSSTMDDAEKDKELGNAFRNCSARDRASPHPDRGQADGGLWPRTLSAEVDIVPRDAHPPCSSVARPQILARHHAEHVEDGAADRRCPVRSRHAQLRDAAVLFLVRPAASVPKRRNRPRRHSPVLPSREELVSSVPTTAIAESSPTPVAGIRWPVPATLTSPRMPSATWTAQLRWVPVVETVLPAVNPVDRRLHHRPERRFRSTFGQARPRHHRPAARHQLDIPADWPPLCSRPRSPRHDSRGHQRAVHRRPGRDERVRSAHHHHLRPG